MRFRFSVVVLTGGKPRHHMTAQAIKSINSQSFKSIQRILINNGRDENEIRTIESNLGNSSSLHGWEIINMGLNSYNPHDLTSVWGPTGQAVIESLKGEFTFLQNDDDFLAEDFFELIDFDFNNYPSAQTAIGQVHTWNWDTNSADMYFPNKLVNRPIIESGQKLFERIINLQDYEYSNNPGISHVCRTSLIKMAGKHFFHGGIPDYPALMQIVPVGYTIFNKNAKIYYGRHADQQRHEWNLNNTLHGYYYSGLKGFEKHNLEGAKLTGTLTGYNRNSIEYFFKQTRVNHAFNALIFIVKNFNHVWKSSDNLIFISFRHFFTIINSPIFSLRILYTHCKSYFN